MGSVWRAATDGKRVGNFLAKRRWHQCARTHVALKGPMAFT